MPLQQLHAAAARHGDSRSVTDKMIDFNTFRSEDGTPVYRQIVLYIKRGAVAGSISDGDELPSRRVLSARLGINPNTVQKAYALLESEGLIESRSGAKSYMTLSPQRIADLRAELLTSDIRLMVNALKQSGLSRQEALILIDRWWESDENGPFELSEPEGAAAEDRAFKAPQLQAEAKGDRRK